MEPRRTGPFPFTPIDKRPKLNWPNGARLALWVTPNIEFFPLDEAVPRGSGRIPDVSAWSARDYGARIGIYRIMDVLSRRHIRASVMLNAEVCDEYPEVIEAAMKLEWEFLGHNQSNSRNIAQIPPESEKAMVHDTFARIAEATGKRPEGWLGAGLYESWNTLDYLADEGCRYVTDWVNDDQPYLMDIGGRQMVSMPYAAEINDLPVFLTRWQTPDEFERMIRHQFDVLYREGADSGRVMCISLHPFVIGVPHRIGALERGLDYIFGHEGVWCATGKEILDHYLASGATF